ncbi:YceI family protein [Parasediminibacterium sp. JCM 36343]|uniref:YceI family protein n=1 Tax=Parasediminibacterium sp. JCM 36343 TaxID=3374279 RepID=UPI00397CC148
MKPLQWLSKKGALLLLFTPMIASMSMAQVKFGTKDDLNILISGTSTLHDWDMKDAKGQCTAVFVLNDEGKPTGLKSLYLTIPAEGLKSGHSGMDKNAYKSLKTSANPNITYTLTSATVGQDGVIKSTGKLTIAGATTDAALVTNYKMNADKSITVNGMKKLSMSDFNMEPPTFMMGAIKTGNDIVLKFDVTLNK